MDKELGHEWSGGSPPSLRGGTEGSAVLVLGERGYWDIGKGPSLAVSVLEYLKSKEPWRAALLSQELLRHLKINSLALGGAFSETFHRSLGKETSTAKVPKEPLPAQ